MESRLGWVETYSVGHPELDNEHRELIAHINELHDAVEAQRDHGHLRNLLAELKKAAIDHFAHENAVLRELAASKNLSPGYVKAMSNAAIQEHIVAHRHSAAELESFILRALHQPGSATAELCDDIKRWFIDHAVKHDAHIKAVFQALI
jgi:hemerythrin